MVREEKTALLGILKELTLMGLGFAATIITLVIVIIVLAVLAKLMGLA